MNPFTESTVARPLSEQPSGAAKDETPEREINPDGQGPESRPPAHGASRMPFRHPRASWPGRCRKLAGALLGLALALALPAAWAVDANSATAQQLETITGIGPKTAQVIIDERARGGSFESFEDLAERVKGIGPKKARSLQAAGLTVGRADAAAANSAASSTSAVPATGATGAAAAAQRKAAK